MQQVALLWIFSSWPRETSVKAAALDTSRAAHLVQAFLLSVGREMSTGQSAVMLGSKGRIYKHVGGR